MSAQPARPARPVASGLAHVAALSFLAARAAPPLGFWLALAGGVALARAGERRGVREGYGASLAAILELVAIVGPARLGASITQAASAPLLGRLEGRGVRRVWQVVAAMAIRCAYLALAVSFFVLVILGGLDAYAGTYDSVLGRLPFAPRGSRAAVLATAAAILSWSLFASIVQVLVYGRGLRRWPDGPRTAREPAAPAAAEPVPGPRFDPRAVALAAVVAFAILLAGTRPLVLGAVAAWLALAAVVSRPERDVLPATAFLGGLLAVGALSFSVIGGLGWEEGLQRAARALLLVSVAGWLRGAAGFAGLREVTRRTLGRLRRVPAFSEASGVLDELGSGRGMLASARALLGALRSVPRRPLPVVDAVLDWVSAEAERFRPAPAARLDRLRLRLRDVALGASAAAPALAFAA